MPQRHSLLETKGPVLPHHAPCLTFPEERSIVIPQRRSEFESEGGGEF